MSELTQLEDLQRENRRLKKEMREPIVRHTYLRYERSDIKGFLVMCDVCEKIVANEFIGYKAVCEYCKGTIEGAKNK